MARKRDAGSDYRRKLPDGTRIERKSRTGDNGERELYGNWSWVVYDPDRRPCRKKVNLYTRDADGAYGKARDLARDYAMGAFDPWADAAGTEAVTVAEAVTRYLRTTARGGGSPATQRTRRVHLEGFVASLAPGSLVKHVEARHITDFVDKPKPNGEPRANNTRARILAAIRPFLSWAVTQGLARTNPSDGIKTPKGTAGRRDHITRAEAEAILRAIEAAEVMSGIPRQWLKNWFVFGFGTGLRPGEQRQLTWGAVHLAERTIQIGKGHRTKTSGSARTVLVRGEALAVLRRLSAARVSENPNDLVFTGVGGGPVDFGYLRKQLKRFAAEAGVRKNVTAYSLRHGFGTVMVSEEAPIFKVAKMMGTSVEMIEKHYAHYDPSEGAVYLERVFEHDRRDAVDVK